MSIYANANIPTIFHTMRLVNEAFRNKADRGGQPYIFHLTTVAAQFDTLAEQTVALLHDLIEDTEYSLDDLQVMGYPDEIVRAVDCLTKRGNESYEVYLMRVKQNELARKIKLEDLAHNMTLSRLGKREDYTEEAWKKIMTRYEKYVTGVMYLKHESE